MTAIAAAERAALSNDREARAPATSCDALFVSPHARRDGFWASIRGHVLDLADPSSGHALAPTPDDLFIVSIASEVAWTARKILRTHGLPDDVSVSAKWQADADPPGLANIDLTVTVSPQAKAAADSLAAAFANTLAARSLTEPVARISWDGAKR